MKATALWGRSFAVGSLSVISLFGCATIIGLDDYTVAKPAGSAGSAGSSGRAGGSSIGDGGESGGGGDGGDGETPSIVGCDGKTPFKPNEDIIQSCIVRAACNPDLVPVRTISTCVTYDTQLALPGENPTLSAKSCPDYEKYEHVGIAKDDLCGGGKETRCEGKLAINCGNFDTNRFSDCEALGGTCATYDFKGTTFADCKLDIAPDTCAGKSDDTKFYCHKQQDQADLRYYCWQNEAYGSTCTSAAYCGDDDPPGAATCYYNLPACSGSTVQCKDNAALVCSDGGLFKYDCDKVGLTCGISDGNEYCFAPGCKPADVDSDCTETCSDDGTRLTFCYGGTPHTVDCAHYGFSHCESKLDDNDRPFAACRP